MNYGEVLQKAWQIIWKNKVLWIFGILAGCSSRANGSNGSSRGSSGSSSGSTFNPSGFGGDFLPRLEQWGRQVERGIENLPVWVYVLAAALIILLVLVALALGTIGRAGLIWGAARADQDNAAPLTFGLVWSNALQYFWRVLLLLLLVGVVAVLLVVLLVAPLIAIGALTRGIGLICLIPFICLMVPVLWIINLVMEQATVALVVEDLGVLAGIQRAWEVLKANIAPYIVMTLIIYIGSTIITMLLALPILIALVPLLGGVLFQQLNLLQAGLITSVALLCIYALIATVLNGILQAYIGTAWTLTFRRLTHPVPAPVIVPPAAV